MSYDNDSNKRSFGSQNKPLGSALSGTQLGASTFQKGVRAPTKVELKAKERFESLKGPKVARIHDMSTRNPLSSLKAGDKYRGRIITVAEFGLFVDIGTRKDGLVHIKDISKDYFVENLPAKFIPGQDIDVWIKFVSEKDNKLGLQMYAPIEQLSKKDLKPSTDEFDEEINESSLSELKVGDMVQGKVIKSSKFGVFVDIGDAIAFLHRRKMKINRRQRNLKPWEIIPIGTIFDGYVFQVDAERTRVELTTYLPTEWDTRLPSPQQRDDNDDDYENEDEELGGSTKAANLRALERTLAINLDDDDDEDNLDDEDFDYNSVDEDEEEEILSAEEIRKLTANRKNPPKLVMDDFNSKNKKKDESDSNNDASLTKDKSPMNENDKSIDELFSEIAHNRDYVTLNDLNKWDYLNELKKTDKDDTTPPITQSIIENLFKKASGNSDRKLNIDQFEYFIDSLVDQLGLVDDDGSYDEEISNPSEISNKGSSVKPLIVINDTDNDDSDIKVDKNNQLNKGARKSFKNKEIDEDEDETEEEEISVLGNNMDTQDNEIKQFIKSITDPNSVKITPLFPTQESPYSAVMSNKQQNLADKLFFELANGESKISLDRFHQLDFVNKFIQDEQISYEYLNKTFKDLHPDGIKTSAELVDFLVSKLNLKLLNIQKSNKSENKIDRIKSSLIDDDYVEMDMPTEFELLSKGSKNVNLKTLLKWPLILALIDSGDLTEYKIEQIYTEATAIESRKKGFGLKKVFPSLDYDGFVRFATIISNSVPAGFLAMNNGTDASLAHHNTAEATNLPVIPTPEENKIENIEEDEDNQILENVFDDLSKGKEFVTAKDLMDWDFVLDLMAEGLLTEESLEAKIKEYGNKSTGIKIKYVKGLSLPDFDKFVDELVGLYERNLEDDENESKNDDNSDGYEDID
eukprot:gene13310-17832_t